MNKQYLLLILFQIFYSGIYSQQIIETISIPSEITIEVLKELGDSIKIRKADSYNSDIEIINKKDTVNISYLNVKYYLKNYLSECSQFNEEEKTLVFKNAEYEVMRVNSEKLSFFKFAYTDLYSSKRYIFVCTIDKLKELDDQIRSLFEN